MPGSNIRSTLTVYDISHSEEGDEGGDVTGPGCCIDRWQHEFTLYESPID